eukprot:228563-Rhodomonas_salina.1
MHSKPRLRPQTPLSIYLEVVAQLPALGATALTAGSSYGSLHPFDTDQPPRQVEAQADEGPSRNTDGKAHLLCERQPTCACDTFDVCAFPEEKTSSFPNLRKIMAAVIGFEQTSAKAE